MIPALAISGGEKTMFAAGVGTEKRNNSGKAGIIAVILLLLLMAAVAGGYVFLQKMGAPVNPESEEQIAVPHQPSEAFWNLRD